MFAICMQRAIATAAFLAVSSGLATAEPTYRATGDFTGSFCSFLVCKLRPVVAFTRNGGPVEAMPEIFGRVSEFSGATGLCRLQTNKSGLRFHGHNEQGALTDFGEAEFVAFPCIRQ